MLPMNRGGLRGRQISDGFQTMMETTFALTFIQPIPKVTQTLLEESRGENLMFYRELHQSTRVATCLPVFNTIAFNPCLEFV
jgi:hypothetical protein